MSIYQSNISEYETKILRLTNILKRLSILRVIAFILFIVIIIILVNVQATTSLLIVIPICMLGFALLVNRYNKIAHHKRHTTFLKEINESEVLRLENKLSGFSSGQAFIDRDHPYVSDLDIFGSHSLFQLLNRTTTEAGYILLAEWLSEPAPKTIILERQQAIKELSPKLGWRQQFQAWGMPFENNTKSDYNKLLAMVEKPIQLLPYQTKFLMVSILLSILSTLATVYFIIHLFTTDINGIIISVIPLAVILIINTVVLKKVKPIAEEITENIHDNIKILGGYRSLIYKIESETFYSDILLRLQSVFNHNNKYSVTSEIKRLKSILEIFRHRGAKGELLGRNSFYSILNVLWFLDVYLIILTEKWKKKNSVRLRDWASVISEFEVLSSLASFHYSNPTFTFPEITEEPYNIQFEMLGHPLISSENRVCNNFNLVGQGEITMITGSNMAGKSTFLRTVGVNLVLAFMGAPCCAKSGKVSNIQLFTSMRTQDNLEEGISSFYAELKRIEQLLRLIKSGQPIYFLLDEMFKGTNSQDRHKGGISLIKQLSELNAFGIISTHDLDLARLSGKHMIVSNYSFNSSIHNGKMSFDYKLKEDICRDFNASELMKRSGIKVLSDFEDL